MSSESPDAKKTTLTGITAGVLLALVLLALAGLIIVYTGAYNVAASASHLPLTRWAIETTMHASIEGRAGDIPVPDELDLGQISQDVLAQGAAEYKEMCEHCHAGPGVERASWAEGMLPQPPHLTEEAGEWRINEIYWIVSHGIKMSGMPAFSGHHDEQALWSVAAFVTRLPGMTAQEYADFPASH